MSNKTDGRDWELIRQDYIKNGVALTELSRRYQIPLRTVQRHAARGKWRSNVADAADVARATAVEVAKRQGQEIGLTAARLVDRTNELTTRLLDRVEQHLEAGTLNVTQFRLLVASWKDVVVVGRKSFGLDENRPSMPLVGLAFKVEPGSAPRVCNEDPEPQVAD